MASSVVNFQYIGYLGDFLNTYNDIDSLTDEFQCAKYNYETAQEKLKEYEARFSKKNCIVGILCMWLILFALMSPTLLIPRVSVIPTIIFCGMLACVIILVSSILYRNKVLPKHKANLSDEVSRARVAYEKAYKALVDRRSNLAEMQEGMDEQCSYPLSIYIMREAAKEGACSNIPQGVRYFRERYRTLEGSHDELAVGLKHSIDNEKTISDNRREFLDTLDENARTLFDK